MIIHFNALVKIELFQLTYWVKIIFVHFLNFVCRLLVKFSEALEDAKVSIIISVMCLMCQQCVGLMFRVAVQKIPNK